MTRRKVPDHAPSLIPDFSYDPPDVPLSVLYEDAHILVVDKPAGLLSVPGKLEGRQDCLISRLQAAYWDALVVHRLDCDTSGVMIFARTKQAQAYLGQEFEKRRARKTYVARIWGVMEQDRGHVDLPLGSDWPNRPRQMVDHENGRPAQTDWEVIGRTATETRVRLHPLTGRSHQLRVHMLALGHPIIGDQIYATGDAGVAPRLLLHSESLSLHHPGSGESVTFCAPVPF
jgi:tRNA pseudouridine32 synthase / 23S rRNA pseudouridine746 synthase